MVANDTITTISEMIHDSISTIYGEIVESQEQGKFFYAIVKRNNRTSYPNHPFALLCVEKKPKARISKYQFKFSYVQRTYEDAKSSFDAKLNRLKEIEQEKLKVKEERKILNSAVKASDFYQLGDIIYNSWGYEQTNVEFYQVVRMTAKTICVEEIAQEQVPESMQGHGMSCDVIAVKDSFLKNGGKFRLQVKVLNVDGDHYLTGGERFYSFGKWGGKPKYCSWYA